MTLEQRLKSREGLTMKTYDVQNIINAEFNLEPIKCRYCGYVGEVTYHQYIGDAYCGMCGKWQLEEVQLCH